MSSSSGKFSLGLLLGAALGAAAVYFSDKEKRERFSDDLSDGLNRAKEGVDRAKDSLVERYYEAKDRYIKCGEELEEETEELINEIEELAD